MIASIRAGSDDVVSEAELQQWVADLITDLEAQSDDEAREAFLFQGLDICEANYLLIATEFDGLDMG